jgi:hypothetical protein
MLARDLPGDSPIARAAPRPANTSNFECFQRQVDK